MNNHKEASDIFFSRAEAPVFVVSDEIAELARKNESNLLHRVRIVKGVNVAKRLNTSEATVSRMPDWEFKRMGQIMAALSLKAVPIEMRCLPAEQMAMLEKNQEILASMLQTLKQNPTVGQLTFDDDE